jgi:hypothetical protein
MMLGDLQTDQEWIRDWIAAKTKEVGELARTYVPDVVLIDLPYEGSETTTPISFRCMPKLNRSPMTTTGWPRQLPRNVQAWRRG